MFLLCCQNDIISPLATLLAISARSAFTVKGITLYYSELEYREFMRIQDEKLRKQFKVTQIIAVISAVAVVLQVILAYAEFFKLR